MSTDEFLLRVVRGRILDGKRPEFMDVCRSQVAGGARSVGLLSFMGGFRRVDEGNDFILASTWESDAAAAPVVGADDAHPNVASNLRDIAVVDHLDRYTVRPPVFRGILDAPGAVIRVVHATIREGRRDDLYRWLYQKEREIRGRRMVLGWAMGDRPTDGRHEVIGITAWPSPLTIEAVAEPGRTGTAIFAAVEEFVTDITLQQYQSLELDLPHRLSNVAGRRVLVARFGSESAANQARDALADTAKSAAESGISVARAASAGLEEGDSHLIVARVSHAEWLDVERVIVDNDGQIIHAADEG